MITNVLAVIGAIASCFFAAGMIVWIKESVLGAVAMRSDRRRISEAETQAENWKYHCKQLEEKLAKYEPARNAYRSKGQ